MIRLHPWANDRRGTAAIEAAVLLPVFLLLVFALVEATLFMTKRSGMQYACDAAARYAMADTTLTDTQILTYAETKMAAWGGGATFTITHSTTNSVNYITVAGTFTYQPISALFSYFHPTVSLKSKVALS